MSRRVSYRRREAEQKMARAFTRGDEALVADALDLKRQCDGPDELAAPDVDIAEMPRAAPMPRTRRTRVVIPARRTSKRLKP